MKWWSVCFRVELWSEEKRGCRKYSKAYWTKCCVHIHQHSTFYVSLYEFICIIIQFLHPRVIDQNKWIWVKCEREIKNWFFVRWHSLIYTIIFNMLWHILEGSLSHDVKWKLSEKGHKQSQLNWKLYLQKWKPLQ